MSILLQVTGLHKSYGPHTILDNADFSISDQQKIGVIGRNGAGKSTLFKIIVGEESFDSGKVQIHESTKIGYLTQHNNYEDDEIVIDFLTRTSNKAEWECGKVAGKFQIKNDLLISPITSLAGGYQMRVKLISMLLQDPNLLLLDEPTNYLDLSTQILFEKFLENYKGSFLLISHDREFIKRTCDETLEIEQGKTTLFPRPIQEYLEFKKEQLLMVEKHNTKIDREKKHLQKFVDRFRAKASKASQAQSKVKQIQKLKTIEISNPLSTTNINIPNIEEKKGIALKLENLQIGYTDKPIAKDINLEIERGQKIAVLGDNGQGKTTLLKTLAGEIQKLSGSYSWGHNIQIAYYAQHIPATLNFDETVKSYLKRVAPPNTSEQTIYEMAGNFLFKEEALRKKIPVLSGGEKARLCLAQILLQKNHVILLDEPTNHLDFETVEAFATALRRTNVTVIFVSHNRTFVEIIANGIIEVKNGTVKRYNHNYEQYVYHLQKDIEKDLETSDKPEKKLNQKQNKEQKTNTKEIKKKLRNIENKITKLEEEKTTIMQWFEENFTKFSKEKTRRLTEIQKEIQQNEEQWMTLENQLEIFS